MILRTRSVWSRCALAASVWPAITLGSLAFASGVAAATVSGATPARTASAAFDLHDYTTARRIWEQLAQQGDADAAYHIGLLYDLGQGVQADAAQAFAWYMRAARRGLAVAEFNVGVMMDAGNGISRNVQGAALWYARAAAHGHPRAQVNLAELYAAGDGVPQNLDLAQAWLEPASRSVPIAGERLSALHAQQRSVVRQEPAADTGLAAPAPATLDAGTGTFVLVHQQPLELVWTDKAQPAPVRYFVTVVAARDKSWVPVHAGFTRTSAMLVPPVPGATCLAWRVYAVGIGVPHYTPSAWSRIGCQGIGTPSH